MEPPAVDTTRTTARTEIDERLNTATTTTVRRLHQGRRYGRVQHLRRQVRRRELQDQAQRARAAFHGERRPKHQRLSGACARWPTIPYDRGYNRDPPGTLLVSPHKRVWMQIWVSSLIVKTPGACVIFRRCVAPRALRHSVRAGLVSPSVSALQAVEMGAFDSPLALIFGQI